MLATSSIPCTQTAMMSCPRPMERMPFSMPVAGMSASAQASTLLLVTGVITSVSLFVSAILVPLLLVGLVVLITLLLTCLTRLVGLESLVGLTGKPSARTARGD